MITVKRGLLLILATGFSLILISCNPQPDPGTDAEIEQNDLEQDPEINEDKAELDQESPVEKEQEHEENQDKPEEAKKDRIRSNATFKHEITIKTDGEIREGDGERWWEDDRKNDQENSWWDND